ncbi:MAG: BrnA antitoxin family protein [Gemmatimonadales bacterium]
MRKEYDFSKGRRNPYAAAAKGKTRITIRIDDDILAWFRDRVNQMGGGNYQTLINQALRNSIASASEPLETVVRRVVRQELAASGPRVRRRKRQAA